MKRHSLVSKVMAVLVAVGLTFPVAAFADPERAAQYYQEASEAYQAGELQKAADLLERAFAENPDLVYQYNRILALEGLKDFGEALRVLSIYEEPMKRDSQKRFEDIAEIRKRLEEGKAATPVEKPDETPDEIPDEKPDEKPIEKPVEKPIEPEGPNILAWSLIGVGIASVGVGGLFGSGLLAGDAKDNVQCVDDASSGAASLTVGQAPAILQTCYGSTSYQANFDSYTADQDTLDSHQTMTIVFVGAGVALATAGIVIWALDSGDSSSANDDVPVSAGLTPYLAPDGAGAVLNVTF